MPMINRRTGKKVPFGGKASPVKQYNDMGIAKKKLLNIGARVQKDIEAAARPIGTPFVNKMLDFMSPRFNANGGPRRLRRSPIRKSK